MSKKYDETKWVLHPKNKIKEEARGKEMFVVGVPPSLKSAYCMINSEDNSRTCIGNYVILGYNGVVYERVDYETVSRVLEPYSKWSAMPIARVRKLQINNIDNFLTHLNEELLK